MDKKKKKKIQCPHSCMYVSERSWSQPESSADGSQQQLLSDQTHESVLKLSNALRLLMKYELTLK